MWAAIWPFITSISGKAWKYIAGFFAAIGIVIWAYFSGRKSRQRQLYLDNAEVNRRMYEESLKGPKSKEELVERIRGKGL